MAGELGVERRKGGDESGAGSGFEDELPGETGGGTLMEARSGRGELDGVRGVLERVSESGGGGADFGEGGFFGLVGDGDFGEVGEGRERLATTFFNQILIKAKIIGAEGEVDDWVFGAVGLDNDRGGGEMAATDTTDDLSKELEGFFFGGEIGKRESGVGLDNGNRGKKRKVETFGEGLGADKELDFAGLDFGIEGIEGIELGVVGVEASKWGIRKELFEL